MDPAGGIVAKISGRLKGHLQAYAHWKADRIAFRSGLGDASYLLYGLARSMKPSICVEIGSARGRSTSFIGMALKENGPGRLFAIDPHAPTSWNDADAGDTFAEISRNIERLGLSGQVEILRKTSAEAARDWQLEIDLLFIDGDHSYEGVRRDWDMFVPHMARFGMVVFHDTLWDLRPDPKWSRADMGVPAFVEELRAEGYPVITIDRDFGVSMVQPALHGIALRN